MDLTHLYRGKLQLKFLLTIEWIVILYNFTQIRKIVNMDLIHVTKIKLQVNSFIDNWIDSDTCVILELVEH